MKGLEINEDTLGGDALAENGPGEHLFGTAHTLRHYKTAYWESELDDINPYETWKEDGGKDSLQRAHERVNRLLNEFEAPALDEAIDEQLQDFMARRKAALKDKPADF